MFEVLAVLPAEFDAATFLLVIDRWVLHPELVIPPIKETKVLQNTPSLNADTINGRQVLRQLLPKRADKDAVLSEKVSWFEEERVIGVEFAPQLAEDEPLPFYYPRVHCYQLLHLPQSALNFLSRDGESSMEPSLFASLEARVSSNQHDPTNDPYYVAVRKRSSEIQQAKEAVEPVALNTKVPADRFANHWLYLINKLKSWGKQTAQGYKKRMTFESFFTKDAFDKTYARLKATHGHWASHWPEKTDPRKYVYEELAIAAYLLCLWEQQKPVRFVDLGCGNGFLTYLLTQEGHTGFGIDQARRKIWDSYSATSLRAETIDPSVVTYPDVDWIVGNHADELVPWIPIIAHRSGYHVKFVHIACCFFDFGGAFTPKQVGGRYHTYLSYLMEIGRACGFDTRQENVRIPSTKNTVQIGLSRTYAQDDIVAEENIAKAIAQLLERAHFGKFVARQTDRVKQEVLLSKRKARQTRSSGSLLDPESSSQDLADHDEAHES